MLDDHEISPDSPVLIAWAAVEQREDDHSAAKDAVGLILQAARTALPGDDGAKILEQVDWIAVPEGTTKYADPGRLVADALGATGARTIFAKFGVMQQTLISQALAAVASGESLIAVVCGAEAKYRDLRARLVGEEPALTPQDSAVTPDEVQQPRQDLVLECEIKAGLRDAAPFYAIMESARRAHLGEGLDENRKRLGELYSRFTEVAARNPHANRRDVLQPGDISEVSEKNPMLAFPYTKRMASAWTVDQAAFLVMCTARTAQELGVSPDRWIVPLVAVESNYMPALSARKDLTQAAAMAVMGRAASAATGVEMSEVDFLDIYSCFPIAVQMQAEGLGVGLGGDRDLTITGGMPFAGGPLNNYVFQTTCRAADLLLESTTAATALVSCVSGLYTKQGFTLWSTLTSATPFEVLDVTDDVAAAESQLEVVTTEIGAGVIAGYTVVYDQGQPSHAIAVVDLDDTTRTTVGCRDAADIDALLTVEGVGRYVTIDGGQFRLAESTEI